MYTKASIGSLYLCFSIAATDGSNVVLTWSCQTSVQRCPHSHCQVIIRESVDALVFSLRSFHPRSHLLSHKQHSGAPNVKHGRILTQDYLEWHFPKPVSRSTSATSLETCTNKDRWRSRCDLWASSVTIALLSCVFEDLHEAGTS
jgi:hypothetical protein